VILSSEFVGVDDSSLFQRGYATCGLSRRPLLEQALTVSVPEESFVLDREERGREETVRGPQEQIDEMRGLEPVLMSV